MVELRCALQALRVAIKREQANRLSRRAAIRLKQFIDLFKKYSENQPRDPRGRWTAVGHVDDDGPQEDYASFNEDRPRNYTISRNMDRTGDERVDGITKKLEDKAIEVADRLGFGEGAAYGSRFHKMFADEIQKSGIPLVEIEQSWVSPFERAIYGTAGSVRTDVTLRSYEGEILAVWDLKTGRSGLNTGRVDTLRRILGIDERTSIIEISLRRGTTNKDFSVSALDWSDKLDDTLCIVMPRLLEGSSWQQAVDRSNYLRHLVLADQRIQPGVPVTATLNGIAVTFTIDRFEFDQTDRAAGTGCVNGFSTTCKGRLEDVTAGLIALLSYARACDGRVYLSQGAVLLPLPNANLDAHVDALLAAAFDAEAEWNERYPDRVEKQPTHMVIWSGRAD